MPRLGQSGGIMTRGTLPVEALAGMREPMAGLGERGQTAFLGLSDLMVCRMRMAVAVAEVAVGHLTQLIVPVWQGVLLVAVAVAVENMAVLQEERGVLVPAVKFELRTRPFNF